MIFPGCTLVYYLINYTKERIMMKKLQLRRGFVDHPFLSFCLRETSHQPDWPLLKKLKLMNNCKKRNYSCKQFVIYVEEACFSTCVQAVPSTIVVLYRARLITTKSCPLMSSKDMSVLFE